MSSAPSAPPDGSGESGRVVDGRYELASMLGQGGSGSVWAAWDRRLERRVALKRVPIHDERQGVRLEREARAAARISHPNVATVHDVLVQGDVAWIIMPLVEGRSLQAILARDGRLVPGRVASVGSQILSGLMAAHQAGVLHRDVKPSNILVSDGDKAVLTDFGVAQIGDEASVTQTGQVTGSVGYIAPERLLGAPATAASDLWSLGATLYATLEGHLPFDGATSIEVIEATVSSVAAPVSAATGALRTALTGLLERDPDKRLTAGRALAQLHEAIVENAADPPASLDPDSDTLDWPISPPPPDASPDIEPQPPAPPKDQQGPSEQQDPSEQHEERDLPAVPAFPSQPQFQAPPGPYGQGYPQLQRAAPWPMQSPGPVQGAGMFAATRTDVALPRQPDFSSTRDVPLVPYPDALAALSASRRFRLRLFFRRTRARPLRPRPMPTVGRASIYPSETYSLNAALREPFQYVHEPLQPGDTAIPLLGNERLIKGLKERLANSRGGAFLVTGFRGVGKTTLVQHALAELAADHPRGRRLLPVVLSVARPMETEKLLFAIVRRVFEELTEAGVLDDLPADTRQSLLLAYMRTSLSFKETRTNSAEHTANLDLDPTKVLRGVVGPAAMAFPKAGLSTKRSRSLATESAFLAYSETDVEHDMMRIVRMLSEPRDTGRKRRWRRSRPPIDLQLVVVLDEVDKLTSLENGIAEVERLLSGIKNVVTMRGAHYLVVAGPELHDQVLHESGRGNSVYESIFAWRLYVPCCWTAPSRLLADLVHGPQGRVVEDFERYLRFKSRGVLRRLLHELNSFVVWEDARRPYLRIGSRSYATISFYAQLERHLDAFFIATLETVLPTPIDQDRWRLGSYYVMDWILRSRGLPFTSADVMQAVDEEEFDPLLNISQPGVDLLLSYLGRHRVLDVVRAAGQATSTLVTDVSEAQLTSYRLAASIRDRFVEIVISSEDERAELEFGYAPLASVLAAAQSPMQTIGGRYELFRLIGEGATSSVYEGRDTLLHRPVAVKLLRTGLRGDELARRRFLREARIAQDMHHPGVVDVYELVPLETPDASASDEALGIVMELINGPTLRELIRVRGPLPGRQAVRIGVGLGEALDYLSAKGLARIDLKPENIVMNPARGPVIIDLGIAKVVDRRELWPDEPAESRHPADSLTQQGIVVGTPAYLAPEQMYSSEVDIRADIYALGLVLYTCLAGAHPYEGLDSVGVMGRLATSPLSLDRLPCSPELRQVVGRATAREVADRFQRPTDMVAALRATPECE